ncbi:MAG TPA: hypothetical protein VF463_11265 [Sphingobium sp.]
MAPDERLTLTIELADGSVLPVTLHSDSIGFIGHYARLPAFGPREQMLKFHLLPAR